MLDARCSTCFAPLRMATSTHTTHTTTPHTTRTKYHIPTPHTHHNTQPSRRATCVPTHTKLRVLTPPPRRARKIHLAAKVVPRKHPAPGRPPHRHPSLGSRRHKSGISRPGEHGEPSPAPRTSLLRHNGRRIRLLELPHKRERLAVRLGYQEKPGRHGLTVYRDALHKITPLVAEAAHLAGCRAPEEPALVHGRRRERCPQCSEPRRVLPGRRASHVARPDRPVPRG